jgi:DNA-binding transcriptional LysR family regulator
MLLTIIYDRRNVLKQQIPMNTRFLETLAWLSRLGSFRETARHMHATQAAVSQRIATLEDDLGALLVDRAARELKLTPVGERVLQHAERLLALERELRLAARPEAPPAGRVRIGVIESVVHTWLTAQVRALARQFPAIEPDFTVDTARNLRQQFRQHRLDVLIQNDPVEEAAGNEELHVAELCRFPIQWVGRPDLLPRRRLRLEDLMNVPLLTFSRTSSPHAHVRALFIGSERAPRISSFPSVAAILRLVWEGFGLAAIPPLFVRPDLERGSLQQYAGPALPPLDVTVVSLRAAAPAVHAVAATTRDAVAAYCRDVGPPWAHCLLPEGLPVAPSEKPGAGSRSIMTTLRRGKATRKRRRSGPAAS